MWLFGYLQLCVFGVFASVSGDFDLGIGFATFEDTGKVPDEETFHRLTTLKHWFRQPPEHKRSSTATLRSLKAASATFATSRLILFVQYLIVLHFAKKNKRDKKPLYWHLGGLLVSSFLWYGAFAAAFFDNQGAAIARLLLWTTGLAFEFFCMSAAAASQPAYRLDLEYWAERFSALTLIVLGEGSAYFLLYLSISADFALDYPTLVISLFEAFQTVSIGVGSSAGSGSRTVLAGSIFSAIGLYRLLYCEKTVILSRAEVVYADSAHKS